MFYFVIVCLGTGFCLFFFFKPHWSFDYILCFQTVFLWDSCVCIFECAQCVSLSVHKLLLFLLFFFSVCLFCSVLVISLFFFFACFLKSEKEGAELEGFGRREVWWRRGRGNCDQNILYEKIIFNKRKQTAFPYCCCSCLLVPPHPPLWR